MTLYTFIIQTINLSPQNIGALNTFSIFSEYIRSEHRESDKQVEKFGLSSQQEGMKKKTIELGGAPVLDGETDAFIADGYSGADLDRAGLEPPAPSCG